MKKKIFIVLAIIICVYIGFVSVDCIRLMNTFEVTKPIITIASSEDENVIEYTGLGYTVSYSKDTFENDDGEVVEYTSGAEFRLFDKIMIWAWIS